MRRNLHNKIVRSVLILLCSLSFKSFGQTVIFSENMGTPSGTTSIASNTFQNSGTLTYSGTADVRISSASSGYAGASGGGNVFLTNNGTSNFQIANINTVGYTGLTLSFGHFKSTTASNNELVVEVSSDGVSYSPLSYSRPTGSGTANYTLITPTGTIPATSNLRIRFRQTSTSPQFRVDDVKLTGTLAPTVTTTAATAITATGATFNGTINPNGLTVDASFEYGPTNLFGETAASTVGLTGTSDVAVSANVSGLLVNTEYFVRAVGTVTPTAYPGDTVTFYTLANQPGAPFVTNPTTTSLDVIINIGTENDNPFGTLYAVRETTSGLFVRSDGTLGAIEWLSPNTYTVSGLPGNTTYTFEVKAKNGADVETAYGSTASGTTLENLSANLTLVNGLIGFGEVCTNATVKQNFTINGANLDGSDVVVGPTSGYNFSLTENGTYNSTLNIAYGGSSFTNQAVWVQFAPNAVQSYNGNIQLTGGGLASPFSVAVSGSGIDTPVSVTTGSASGATATTATAAGSLEQGCSSVTAYGIEYSTTNGFVGGSGTQVAASNLSGGDFSSDIIGLSPNTAYYFRAYATDGTGTVYGNQQSFTSTHLDAPVSTAGTDIEQTQFTANWEPVSGAESYRLDVSASPDFGTTQLTTDLFFSEYIEGSSSNKYIEIYNGTGASVDLSDYQLRLYANGASIGSPTNTITLSGSLANGATIVYKNGGAVAYSGTAITNAAVNHNGDDAFGLYKISTASFVDIFGTIGQDPGSAWTAPGFSTVDKTLVRNANIFSGITTNPGNGFPALVTEWTQFNIDDVSHLGGHTINNFTPSFLTGYEDKTVNGLSDVVSAPEIVAETNYYYRVRAFSTNSTSDNSEVVTVMTAQAAPTFGGILQVVAVVCEGSDATFNVTGLLPSVTSVLSFDINGTPGTANVVANESGFGSFEYNLVLANNGQTLTVNSVDRFDFPGSPITPTENNTATLSVNAYVTYYLDADTDGFGDVFETTQSCDGAPFGYVSNNTDCDDNNSGANTIYTYFIDNDNDGYGTTTTADVCAASPTTAPAGYSVNDDDCDDEAAGVNPGASEIGYNLIDDDCDGSIDEGFPPKITVIQGAQCNNVLPAIDTQIVANIVAGAQGYHWKVTTMSGPSAGQIQELDTALRVMKLTQLVNYRFDTQYKIEIGVYYAGYLQPYNVNNCTVTTPAATTQLTVCGQSITQLTNAIYANLVPFAAGYRFRITDPTNIANTTVLERSIREFKMSQITDFVVQYNKQYNVEVSVRNTDGSWLPYGGVCQVTTPAFPTTSLQDSQCEDYAVPNNNTLIYAISYPGAIAYVFQVSGPGLVSPLEVTKSTRSFTLNDFPGLIPGATYNVKVRLIFNLTDPDGPFGKTCRIVTPGLSRTVSDKSGFDVVAYPNPFSQEFGFSAVTSSADAFAIKVYDMTGRLLDNVQVKASEFQTYQLGAGYPSGVYNVVVSQGNNAKTLRLVKR